MAPVLSAWLPSRRRETRARSDASKQLHSRWGDSSISAPSVGGWIQHYSDRDPGSVSEPPRADGSPDSQRTLVNTSPEPGSEVDRVFASDTKGGAVHVERERNAITITIPLPWSKRSHRRSSSLTNLPSNIDDRLRKADFSPAEAVLRSASPVVQNSSSPVIESLVTFPSIKGNDRPSGLVKPLLIQATTPPPLNQPSTAVTILSPVAEVHGLSESNNNGTVGKTSPLESPVAEPPSSGSEGELALYSTSTRNRLDRSPPMVYSSSRGRGWSQSPAEGADSIFRHRSPSRGPPLSRPSSRDPGQDRGNFVHSPSSGPTNGRCASREPASRRAWSREPAERRPMSREPVSRRAMSTEPVTRRAMSTEPLNRAPMSPELGTRRAVSREPVSRRPLSGVYTGRRAVSVDPVRRRVPPVDDFQRGSPSTQSGHRSNSPSGESTDNMSDGTTDIENETEDRYFESRRLWNGVAGGGVGGFYANVVQDYRGVAKDVEAELLHQAHADHEATIVKLPPKVTGKKVEEPLEYGGPVLVPTHEELWG